MFDRESIKDLILKGAHKDAAKPAGMGTTASQIAPHNAHKYEWGFRDGLYVDIDPLSQEHGSYIDAAYMNGFRAGLRARVRDYGVTGLPCRPA